MSKNGIDLESLTKFRGNRELLFLVLFKNGENKNFYSDAISELTGYTAEELDQFPEKLYSIIHEDDLAEFKKRLANVESDSSITSDSFCYRIVTKSGKPIWIKENSTYVRDPQGAISEQYSTILDITKQKETELELIKRAESLKELNAAKDKFISIVSHDLRAPFTTLLGFSEILLSEPDLSEEEKNEYLKYIFEASKTQLNMINYLLDWSRLQTGRIKVEPVRLNVKSTVANAITPLTGDAVRKNIDIKIDIPAELHMNADERLIAQAIFNLTSNAIKFTPEGKEITISAQRFNAGMIEIVVKDEGLGISEENQAKLFRIDQKFTLTGTNGEKGSGLGLTLMKEIIEKHGGQVWFYSKIGEGSEFHFTVQEAKNLVLIVEDEPSVIALYKKVIEQALPNFEVISAGNGYNAIGMLKSIVPTVIITDHDMPLMNGIQLVEALNKKETNKTIPVIVISAKLNDEIIKVYSKLGVDKILPKPVDTAYLIEKMKECLF